MITGFRVARGGAQELYGVEPDLTVLGKVLGGGLPAAAFGGPRELMERVAPAGDVYQAGTLSGNPLAVAAGLATLRRLDAAAYARLGRAHRPPRRRLRRARRRARPLQVASAPGLVTLFFSAEPVADFAAAAACDLEAHARFCRAMLERGIYPPPSQFEAWFVSLAHDEAAIDRTLEAAAEALEEALGERRALGRAARARRAAARGGDADLRPRRRRPRAGWEPAPPGSHASVVEAVREGYLLHYGEPRLLAGHDADLAAARRRLSLRARASSASPGSATATRCSPSRT